MINSYRDLRVWQAGMVLVELVYLHTAGFPGREMYGLTSQMRRAAVAVPSNIAEGHTKRGPRGYLFHLSIALGSLAELQTQAEIATRLSYLETQPMTEILEQSTSLSKQLHALRNSLLKTR